MGSNNDRAALIRLADNGDFHTLQLLINNQCEALMASIIRQTDPIMIYRIQGQIAFHNWLFSLFDDAAASLNNNGQANI